MNERTIKQVLTKKINQWTKTINDETVVKAIRKDLIITGGCFPSMILGDTPKDFDCYFRTKETVLLVAQYYADVWNEQNPDQVNRVNNHDARVMVLDADNPSKEVLDSYGVTDLKDSAAIMVSNCDEGRVKMIFPSDGVVGDPEAANGSEELGTPDIQEIDEVNADYIIEKEKRPYFPVFISTNAITLSKGIQIVVRFYGEPDQIHETYDFVHTKAYFDIKKKKVEIPKEVYEATINKTLVYTGSKYPVCSVFRLRKFINRGWHINAGQMLKICMQISDLDLQDINVLEDQLIGVDSLYFMALIQQFRRKQDNDPDFKLSTPYLVSIIDKIF